jgi:hypothetical protein
MNELVSNSQNAFIKKRSIHDNFLYVKNLATRFNKAKIPALLFKLDIRKAFDSVRWEYISLCGSRIGLPLFSPPPPPGCSSMVLPAHLLRMVGVLGKVTRYRRYFSSSPLTLSLKSLKKPQGLVVLTSLGVVLSSWLLHTSLYADDAAVFVAPFKVDIQNLAAILHSFGEVTGLCTNFSKSHVVPIRCDNINLEDVLEGIPAKRAFFPLRYLPLSVWCLRRRDFQHLED